MATQIQPAAPTGTFVDEHYPYRFALAAMIIGFLFVAVAIGLFQLMQRPAADTRAVQAAHGAVIAGWMPAIAGRIVRRASRRRAIPWTAGHRRC